MKNKTKGFIEGFLTAPLIAIAGYAVYKLVKPDYLKDYEEDTEFDDFSNDIDDLDTFDDLDDTEEDEKLNKQLDEFNERANKWVNERFGPENKNEESNEKDFDEINKKLDDLLED